jgi:hypothetical protein
MAQGTPAPGSLSRLVHHQSQNYLDAYASTKGEIHMKHVKMLGLAVVAAMALMAFAGSASATVLTSPAGTQYKGEINASAEPGTSLLLKAGFANITCTQSTVAGTPTNFGGAAATVSGPLSTLTFSSCNATVTVLKKGTLEIHAIGTGPNGTLTSSGAEVTVATGGVSCTYGTTNTDIGTLTGSKNLGVKTATMDISANLTKTAGGFLCASPAAWEGAYVVTKPDYLDVS